MPSNALLGLKEDDGLAQMSGTRGQQKAYAETDATNGHRGHLPSPQDTTRPDSGHKVYPCPFRDLLRDLQINEVPGLSVLLDLLGPRYRLERADDRRPGKPTDLSRTPA